MLQARDHVRNALEQWGHLSRMIRRSYGASQLVGRSAGPARCRCRFLLLLHLGVRWATGQPSPGLENGEAGEACAVSGADQELRNSGSKYQSLPINTMYGVRSTCVALRKPLVVHHAAHAPFVERLTGRTHVHYSPRARTYLLPLALPASVRFRTFADKSARLQKNAYRLSDPRGGRAVCAAPARSTHASLLCAVSVLPWPPG
ncbi:hypothetical protein BC628DRAFT_763714 [Trametes gibbosa]|nr:hypothetical protein BC628DRAFT_763714 [Trametes gibbosa]